MTCNTSASWLNGATMTKRPSKAAKVVATVVEKTKAIVAAVLPPKPAAGIRRTPYCGDSVDLIARRLGVHPRVVHQLIVAGQVPAWRSGGGPVCTSPLAVATALGLGLPEANPRWKPV